MNTQFNVPYLGSNNCATLARKFDMPEVFDHIVLSVSPLTGLLDVATPLTFNYPVTEVEGQTVTVSPFAVQFGTNLKGQLASVVLFTLVNGHASSVREGWIHVSCLYISHIDFYLIASVDPRDIPHLISALTSTPETATARGFSRRARRLFRSRGALPTPQPLARTDVGLLSRVVIISNDTIWIDS